MAGKYCWHNVLLLLVVMVSAPVASANLVNNGSFENGSFVENFPLGGANVMQVLPGSTAIAGWEIIGDGLAWGENGNAASLFASDGLRFLDLTEFVDGPPFGGVAQRISTEVNKIYELAFDLGSSNQFGIPVGIEASAAGVSSIFSSTADGPSEWERVSLQFIAVSDLTEISLLGNAGLQYIGLDNVSVHEIGAVPIPGALWLFGSALLGFIGFSRRKVFF